MAALKQLINPKDLKTNYINFLANGKKLRSNVHYDKVLDTLFIMLVSPEIETVVHYIDDFVGLVYDPRNLEVVGVQIEGFKEFAQKHQSVEKAWEIKLDCNQVDDLGDLYSVKDQKEKIFVREVAKVAEKSYSYHDHEMANA